jgi:hypothetical protein
MSKAFPQQHDFNHLPIAEQQAAFEAAVVAWGREQASQEAQPTKASNVKASDVLAEAPPAVWAGDAPTPDPQPAPALAAIKPTVAPNAPIGGGAPAGEYAPPIANDAGAAPANIGAFIEPEIVGSVEADGSITQPGEAPAPVKRRMPFRGNTAHTRELARDSAAGSMVYQGIEYWYREMPQALKAWAEARPQWMADQLGIPLVNYLQGRYYTEVADPAPGEPNRTKIVPANPEKIKLIETWMDESYNVILLGFVNGDKPVAGCLVDWDIEDVPICRAVVEDMFAEVKATIVQQVQMSMKFGMSFSQFRA